MDNLPGEFGRRNTVETRKCVQELHARETHKLYGFKKRFDFLAPVIATGMILQLRHSMLRRLFRLDKCRRHPNCRSYARVDAPR
jgi:hypothetical protein